MKRSIKDFTRILGKNGSAFIAIWFLIAIPSVWVGISSTIQRFKCPTMTETQLFLAIPDSFVCNWKTCD